MTATTEGRFYPARAIFDPANGLTGVDGDTSVIARTPRYVSIEGMTDAALTSVTVQVRLTSDGAWLDYQAVDTTVPNALIEFLTPPNFVRVVRNPAAADGTEDFVVNAQQED